MLEGRYLGEIFIKDEEIPRPVTCIRFSIDGKGILTSYKNLINVKVLGNKLEIRPIMDGIVPIQCLLSSYKYVEDVDVTYGLITIRFSKREIPWVTITLLYDEY